MHRRPDSRWPSLGKILLVAFVVGTSARPARATVQEQRARLPPPAQCPDPVAGIWRSHDYDTAYGEWTMFALDVRRVDGSDTDLVGTIANESWRGPAEQSQPGPCLGRLHYRISMDAKGSVRDGRIEFTAYGQWRMDELVCGEMTGRYNLDSFTGQIDPDLLEFQSINNDGGRMVDYRVVFRRVQCQDGTTLESEPRIAVAPPPFYPPEDAGAGCGCSGAGG
ncbi:MAG TPA: hypothetical protein VFG69_00515 [Nannocystaceae bacterium]|nr:hypothetical protein [Nannocystaceae bacterium]